MPEVMVAGASGQSRGYLAVPEGQGPWPGVVVVHDVLGMTSDLKRIADRFAASGYLALAPDLYDVNDDFKLHCVIRTVRSHFTGHGPAYRTLLAAREHLVSDSRCSGRVGIAGFCMGGGICLQLAPHWPVRCSRSELRVTATRGR
jgi:carboxymethylenebutenolidase